MSSVVSDSGVFANMVSGDTTIYGNLTLSNSGTNGQLLQKTLSSQAWVTPSFAPSTINPGSNNQALFTRSGNTQWSNISPSDIGTGAANQFLVKDITGATTIFTSNPVCPGNFTVNNVTNLLGNLQLNSVSGSSGQYLKKTSGSTQTWSNIAAADIAAGSNNQVLTTLAGTTQWATPLQIKNIVYGTTFSAQDLNSAAGPTPVSFSTSAFVNIATSNTSPVVAITQPSATQFVVGTVSEYQVEINGFIDPTSTGIGNSIITLSAEIDGVEQSQTCVVCNANYSFSGTISGLNITPTQILRILARRVVGTNPLNTFASGGAVPNFSSTIVIRNIG